MALPPVLQSIVDFLRKGYPQGVPEQDYMPLFALLRRRLSDDEVTAIADDLASQAPDEQRSTAIHEAIHKLLNDVPSETDVDRVRDRLEAAGWEPPAPAHI
jgi:mono/diheme cytochrome c family protein